MAWNTHAAMLVLWANEATVWTRHKVAQWLGARSYSLYLWHWPVVVALVYASWHRNPLAITGALVLTLLLGHLSYKWVEVPSRQWLTGQQPKLAAGVLALAALVMALPGVAVWKLQGVAGRFAPAVELAAAESTNVNPRMVECHPNAGATSPSCIYGGTVRKVIALGDSHANALISGMTPEQNRGDTGVVQWTYGGCAFLPGLKPTAARSAAMGGDQWQCTKFVAWAQAHLALVPSSTPVVVMARYAEMAFGDNDEHDAPTIPNIYFSKPYDRSTPEFLQEFAQHITRSACDLAQYRTVYLMRPIPEMGFDVPKTLSRRMVWGLTEDVFIPLEAYRARNAWVWAAQDAAHDQCGIKILDPTAYLCREGRCYGSKNGRPLYTDSNHLSEFGNKLLTPMFQQVFDAL